MQSGEFAGGLILHRHAGIRIRPKIEQFLIFGAARCDFASHGIGARQAQMRQRKMLRKRLGARVNEDLAEFSLRQSGLAQGKIGAPTRVGLIKIAQVAAEPGS